MKLRLLLLPAIAAILLVAGLACTGPDLDKADVVSTDTVAVKDNSFGPLVAEVEAGSTVTWVWEGNRPHNVVGDGFESKTQEEGTFEVTFDKPGTYDYRCTVHGGMKGRVIVTQ